MPGPIAPRPMAMAGAQTFGADVAAAACASTGTNSNTVKTPSVFYEPLRDPCTHQVNTTSEWLPMTGLGNFALERVAVVVGAMCIFVHRRNAEKHQRQHGKDQRLT